MAVLKNLLNKFRKLFKFLEIANYQLNLIGVQDNRFSILIVFLDRNLVKMKSILK